MTKLRFCLSEYIPLPPGFAGERGKRKGGSLFRISMSLCVFPFVPGERRAPAAASESKWLFSPKAKTRKEENVWHTTCTPKVRKAVVLCRMGHSPTVKAQRGKEDCSQAPLNRHFCSFEIALERCSRGRQLLQLAKALVYYYVFCLFAKDALPSTYAKTQYTE